MERLEEQIQAVLQDPQQMQEIMSLARSLGLSLPELSEKSETKEEAPPSLSVEKEHPNAGQIGTFWKQAGKLDPKHENLLNALKPFLKPERREKVERAIQVARLSHLAEYALKSRIDKQVI